MMDSIKATALARQKLELRSLAKAHHPSIGHERRAARPRIPPCNFVVLAHFCSHPEPTNGEGL